MKPPRDHQTSLFPNTKNFTKYTRFQSNGVTRSHFLKLPKPAVTTTPLSKLTAQKPENAEPHFTIKNHFGYPTLSIAG